MATRRIKESYGPPVVPKDATPQQRQAILQEHRKHQDFVKQLNDIKTEQDDEIATMQSQLANGYIIGMARIATNGAGAITRNITKGVTASFSGAGRVRITFPADRPIINGVTHYNASITPVGTGIRIFGMTTVQPGFFDVVVSTTAGEVFPNVTAQEFILTITDYD